MSFVSVNLTTTAARQDICMHAVLSLINQSLQPDVVRLWISKDPYLRDSGISDVPQWVSELNTINHIIEVRWVDNTGPYRKLLPALSSARPGDLIVTADDDIVYGRDWLKELVGMANKYPGELVAARVRCKVRNIFGVKASYIAWPIIGVDKAISADYVITHGGGAVYSADIIRSDLVKDDGYMSVCPTADDLWYSRIVQESKVPVRVCVKALSQLYFIEHNDGLDNYNNLKSVSFISKVYNKVFLGFLGWLGFDVCGNDYAYGRLNKYFLDK